jgi:hypothetical protein
MAAASSASRTISSAPRPSAAVAAYKTYANSFIYTVNIPGCSAPGRVFVGQRKEGFAVNLGPVFDLVNFVPVEGDSAPGAGDGGGFPGRHHAETIQQSGRQRQCHHHCARGSQELPGREWQWRHRRLDQRFHAPGEAAESAAHLRASEVDGGPWVQVSRLACHWSTNW